MMRDKIKVLLVEDESICQMSMASLAKKMQVDLEIAKNGLEAVKKIENNNTYNLILMDLYMPDMDGKKATQTIRALTNGKSQIIVAMSGGKNNEILIYLDEMLEEELIKYGFNSFVQKPISKNKFENIINQYKA